MHGNRFIAHLVYRKLASEQFFRPDADQNVALVRAKALTVRMLTTVIRTTKELYPESYLASLFKNLNKCREVAERVTSTKAAASPKAGAVTTASTKLMNRRGRTA